jgi:hypothetical protein
MRWPAPTRLIVFALLLGIAAMMGGCASVRYVRDWTRDGESFTDTLELSGSTFRLERISGHGQALYLGRFEVTEGEWRFEISEWKPARGPWISLSPPVVYRYRGHDFPNGIAFYAVILPSESPVDLFIRVPGDFDLVP